MSLMPLSRLLTKPPTGIVAMGDGATVSMQQLQARINCWRMALERVPGNTWVLYNRDPVEFAAALLALWQCNKTACLPGDNLPVTRDRLRSRVDGALGDWPGALQPASPDNNLSARSFRQLDPDAIVVEIYTSGSTGEPQAMPKKLRQLEAEIEALEARWPKPNNAVVVLSTVSHQHIYGLLFRILWPLCRAIPFERRLCHYIDDLLNTAGLYAKLVLISSPSHLGRLPQNASWQALRQRWEQVFSSAAPLSWQDSNHAQQLLETKVYEIYGSSETGGIAWRVQSTQHCARWQPLPKVEICQDDNGTHLLRSPPLASFQWQAMPDRIKLMEDGSFQLLGRADRIAKIEGKRVSLTAMERCLEKLNEIAEARVITLEHRRQETAAVIRLSKQGAASLHKFGNKMLLRSFKCKLAATFEPIALPRRWRLVTELPYNAQGKLQIRALQALCTPGQAAGFSWPLLQKIQKPGNGTVILSLYIDPGLIYFDGHFPDTPILPGVAQLHWAEAYGRQFVGVTECFSSLETIKFQHVVTPDSELILQLSYDKSTHKLKFCYQSKQGMHTSGKICFSASV